MEYLNTHPLEIQLPQALNRVSAQRRSLALRYLREEDRKLSLAAYLLLREALEKEYGIREAPEFVFGPHGKPFLRDYPDVHFNLSHCPAAVLCVVDSEPVGCDIEKVEAALDRDLCQKTCSPEELEAVLGAQDPALAFFSLWTRKEAFLKLTGTGLSDSLPELLYTAQAQKARFETHSAPDGAYVYTVCRFF